MTELYALLYAVPPARVADAARLRVEAADLRDRGGDAGVDWKGVSWILHESYRSLHARRRSRSDALARRVGVALGLAAPQSWGSLHRSPLAARVVPRELNRLAVGAGLARAAAMDEADVTDRVLVIVHTGGQDRDDDPTSPVVLEDNTTRQRCEFEEDTVEEYLWPAAG